MRPTSPTTLIYPSLGERIWRSLRKEDAERTCTAVTRTLRALETVATIFRGVFVGASLEAGLEAPVELLQRAQKTGDNIQGIFALQECVAGLSAAIHVLIPHDGSEQLSPSVLRLVELLLLRWEEVGDRLRSSRRHARFRRLFMAKVEATALASLIDDINGSIHEFLFEMSRVTIIQGTVVVEADLGETSAAQARADQVPADVCTPQPLADSGDDAENDDAARETADGVSVSGNDGLLPRGTKNAEYDANDARKPHLPGTRVAIFNELWNWVTHASTTQPSAGQMLWISGSAGTGKTTVAYSIADKYKKQGMLGGSFFCSRFDAECSDPNMVFTTLSHQLCSIHEPFGVKVAAILRESPDIAEAGPARQLEELIVRPLEEEGDAFPVCVIVIDALDECKGASIILAVLAKFIHRLHRLLFVVTSRPEAGIAAMFQTQGGPLQKATTLLALDEIESSSVARDIGLYLAHEFDAAREALDVPKEWPSQQDIEALADNSGGLWIHAVAAVKFVLDQNRRDPEGRLQSLLSDQPSSEQTPLHSLYAQIANAACSTGAEDHIGQLSSIIGFIAVSQEPLSIIALAGLLDVSERTIRDALQGLHPVLRIPANSHEVVRVIHPTFLEFLTSPLASKPAPFCIEPMEHHLALFSRCLHVMKASLKYDICDIGDPTLFKDEIDDLPERIRQAIPPSLRYACRYWVAHFSETIRATMVNASLPLLQEFLRHHLLNWFEACSLLDALDDAVAGVETARRTCQALGGPFLDLVPLLYDCRRFIFTFAAPINSAPLQAHYSALTLTPHRTLMSQLYSATLERRSHTFSARGTSPNWSSCVDVYPGHGGVPVCSVAFSPDGSCFASGGEDGCVKIWRATTRTLVLSIQHPPRTVITALAFSPDGMHLVSTSNNGTIRICQTSTGGSVFTLESGAESPRFVAYSPDGTRILVAAAGGQIQLWDSSDGRPLLTLGGALAARQAALSPDGSVLAYGLGDTLQLHHLSSGESESFTMPKKTVATAFSADGRHLAIATQFRIYIWSYPSKVLLRSFDNSGAPRRMWFSGDGLQFCYACQDGTVRLWRISDNGRPLAFGGHAKPEALDVVWSPNDSQIVSVGEDGTIRVWDPSRLNSDEEPRFSFGDLGRYHQELARKANARHAFDWSYVAGKPGAVSQGRPHEILSPDGGFKVQITVEPCSAIQILDTCTGMATPLDFPVENVSSVTLSPDGKYIAIGTVQGKLQVRDKSWEFITIHGRHNEAVEICSFSPSSKLVISASANSIVIFDVDGSDVVRFLGPHQGSIMGAAFGTDDEHALSQDSSHTFYLWYMKDYLPAVLLRSFTLGGDAWLHTLDFCLDDSSIRLRSGDHQADVVSLWDPASRAWPVYNVTDGGWVYVKGPGYRQRLGWILSAWRYPLRSGGGTFFVWDDVERRSVELDLSKIVHHMGASGWGRL